MKKLAILNYQFAPMLEKVTELELDFPDWEKVDPKLSFENRQQIFGKIFEEDYDNVRPHWCPLTNVNLVRNIL